MQNIKPSTRALIQFVSPNSNFLGRLVQIEPTQLTDLIHNTNQQQTLEDEEISGFIITNPLNQSHTAQSISQLKQTLSCPVIVWQNIQNETDLYRAREIRADAVITKISSFSAEELQIFFNKAQAMNLLLICDVQSLEDWQKIEPLRPRFIFVEKSFEFLQKVPSTTWLIGSTQWTDTKNLKCQIQDL